MATAPKNPPTAAPKRHGGPGRGQGRKAVDGATGLKRRNIYLDDATVDILRACGDGNISLGIRRAAVLVKSRA